MELQGVYEEMLSAGYALYAVSYDSVDVLAGFAGKYGIEYPLLSDEGSVVIRSLGILNDGAPEHRTGIPHPGVFVLHESGRVRDRRFYASYRERDTGAGILEHVLDIAAPAPSDWATAAGDGVQVRAWLNADEYAWGQRVWLTVELDIGEGLHVYGRPIPPGYYPLEVQVTPMERVTAGEPVYPLAESFRMEGLDEQFFVYTGSVRVDLPLTFMLVDGGDLDVEVSVSYQACSEVDCLSPAATELHLHIAERPLIERPAPRD